MSAASPWFTSPWFGAWAALTTFATTSAFVRASAIFGDWSPLPSALVVGGFGLIAGLLIRHRVKTAVESERWRLPALGIGVAFMTLQMIPLVLVGGLVVVQPESISFGIVVTALVMAPALSLPLILFGGTLSGLTLWGVASLLDRLPPGGSAMLSENRPGEADHAGPQQNEQPAE